VGRRAVEHAEKEGEPLKEGAESVEEEAEFTEAISRIYKRAPRVKTHVE